MIHKSNQTAFPLPFVEKKKKINFLSTYSTVLSQLYLFNKYLIITYNFKK